MMDSRDNHNGGAPGVIAAKPRVLVCDSHPMIQDGIAALLRPDFETVGVATNGRSGVALAEKLSPAIVITEVALPELNGFEVCRQLRSRKHQPLVVFYTAAGSPAFVRQGFRCGASGYVSKSAPVADLLRALREVMRGQQYASLSEREASLVFLPKHGSANPLFRELTPRQCEVLQLVGYGFSAKEIGAKLNVVQKTVEFHKTAIMNALNLKSSPELVRFAVESGIIGAFGDSNLQDMVDSKVPDVSSDSQRGTAASIQLGQETRGLLTTYLAVDEF